MPTYSEQFVGLTLMIPMPPDTGRLIALYGIKEIVDTLIEQVEDAVVAPGDVREAVDGTPISFGYIEMDTLVAGEYHDEGAINYRLSGETIPDDIAGELVANSVKAALEGRLGARHQADILKIMKGENDG